MTDPDPTGPPWARDALYEFLALVEKLVDDLLSSTGGELADSDRPSLERARGELRRAVDELARYIIEPLRESRPWVSDFGYMALLRALQAISIASSRSIASSTIEKFVARERAKTARSGKARRNAPEIERRRAAVREAMKARRSRPATSLEYARLILPDVVTRLGLTNESKKPSLSTIREDVRTILKEQVDKTDRT